MSNAKDFKLTIKDFQIVKNAELTFPNGSISLIVGQSANGKSSILRAIKTLLLNPSGSQKFIRHGTDQTSVSMIYNDNVIEWKRNKTGASYIINGKPYSKLGTKNITSILDNSGFVIDYKNDVLSIEGAWQVLFPFDKSDAELFKLFENIFCVSDSGKIFQAFKSEEDRISKELQEYTNNFNKNKIKIEAIEDLQSKVDLNKLKKYKEKLIDYNDKRYSLNSDISLLKDINKYLDVVPHTCKIKHFFSDNLVGYEKLYKNIKFIEEVKNYPIVKKESLKSFNKDLIDEYLNLKEDIVSIKKIQNYPVVEEKIKKVFDNSLIIEYNSIKGSLETLNNIKKELKVLKEQRDNVEKEIEKTRIKLNLLPYKTCSECGGSGFVVNNI
jgi:hypothetical protein